MENWIDAYGTNSVEGLEEKVRACVRARRSDIKDAGAQHRSNPRPIATTL